jgi:hypothetical protein
MSSVPGSRWRSESTEQYRLVDAEIVAAALAGENQNQLRQRILQRVREITGRLPPFAVEQPENPRHQSRNADSVPSRRWEHRPDVGPAGRLSHERRART